MAGQNVIRDSDDEDSDDATTNPSLPAAAISLELGKVDLESSAPRHLQHSGEPSTGSTELLNREIEDARNSLLEPTPDVVRSTAKPRSSARQLSSSPAVSRLTSRRATTNFAEPKGKKPMITYSRASQDDSAILRSSSSGPEYTPRRRAKFATEFQGVQEHDASPQAQVDQPQCTPIETSVRPDFSGLSDLVPSPTMCTRTPRKGQTPGGFDTDGAKSNRRLNSHMNQPEARIPKQNESVLVGSSPSPKKVSRQEVNDSVNLFQDELSISLPMPAPSNARPKLLKLIRTQHDGGDLPADGPDSDELIDGLPVEQYKPRPSRSRSGHGDVDLLIPVDFSERPEVTAKRKKTRRKTTAFERPLPNSEEDREITQTRNPVVIIETRSNVESTFKAVEKSSSSKARTDHQPEVQNSEPITKSVPLKKRRRSRKHIPEPAEEPGAPSDPTDEVPESKLSDKSSPSKPLSKRRKVSAEIPPRNLLDSESYEKHIEPKSGSPNGNVILEELNDNSNLRLPSHSSEIASLKKASMPPETPQKPAKRPDKHSPIASSKVAYRVGLSKRARIEPLLRIVRK